MEEYKSFEYYIKHRDDYIKKARERENKLFYEEKIKLENEKRNLEEQEKIKYSIVESFVINENADNRFYYFKFIFKEKTFYKIGITSQTLKERYGSDYSKIDKILYDKKIDGAIQTEKRLKEQFKDDIYPLAYLNGGGHTETFDRDILELDI